MKRLIVLIFVLAPTMVFAQWSSDPAENIVLDSTSDLLLLIGAKQTQYGETIIVYEKRIRNNFHLIIRKLDSFGIDKFSPIDLDFLYAGEQKLRAGNINIYSPENKGIIICGEAFKSGLITSDPWYSHIFLVKITEDGELGFGGKELIINPENSWGALPKFCSDNRDFYISHTTISYIDSLGNYKEDGVIRKMSPTGQFLWGSSGVKIAKSNLSIGIKHLIPTPDGCLLTVFAVNDSTREDGAYSTYLRKYNQSGDVIWNKDLLIDSGDWVGYNSCRIDKKGGVYILNNGGSVLNHYNSNGEASLGIQIVKDSSGFELNNSGILAVSSDSDVFIEFDYKSSLEDYYDGFIYGQLITESDGPVLGDIGTPIHSKATILPFHSNYRINNHNIFHFFKTISFDDYANNDGLWCNKIESNGEKAWSEPVWLSDIPIISSVYITEFVNNQAVIVWREYRGGKHYLKAQNIHSDGTLGIKSTSRKEIPIVPELFKGYNPTNKILRFDNSVRGGNYNLYNTSGSIISSGKIKSEVSLPNLPSGIYILNIQTEGNIESHKLFVW